MLGGRFSVVTTLARSVPALEGLAPSLRGPPNRCRVRASDVPVPRPRGSGLRRGPKGGGTRSRGRCDEDGAECIVLGCAGMADLAADLTRRLALPVIDGVAAAATRMVEALVGLGLRTSKVGGYAAPLPKAYAGEFGRFAPGPAPETAEDRSDGVRVNGSRRPAESGLRTATADGDW